MLNRNKEKYKSGFIPFLVVGDPDLNTTEQAIDILIEEGADLIELGVPFSDAMADGPVIQTASERAAKTTSLNDVIQFAQKLGQKHKNFPFVLFTYYNPILKMGLETFAKRAQTAGIYSVLVVDLPPEAAGEYSEVISRYKIGGVFLASPTTPQSRIPEIAKASTAFIYYVSRTGVTGVQSNVSHSLSEEIKRVRALTDRELAIGFGISNATQARQVSELGDAVVVGSAFVKLLSTSFPDFSAFRSLAREIRTATLRGQ